MHDVVPLLDVDGVVEALTECLQSTDSGSLYCPCAPPLKGLFHARTSNGPHRRYCQLPVFGRRMQRF